MPECEEQDETCQKSSEENRVRKAAMAPEVAIANAKTKADGVQVGNDRTERTRYPDALRSTGLVETGSDAKGGYCV